MLFLLYRIKQNGEKVNHEFKLKNPEETDNTAKMAQNELPEALALYRYKMYINGILIAILSTFVCIYFKIMSPIILMLGSAMMFYKGFSLQKKFLNGEIQEREVICTDVKESFVKERLTLTFTTVVNNSQQQEYLHFYNMPKKKVDDFSINSPYLVYFDQTDPHVLLNYILL